MINGDNYNINKVVGLLNIFILTIIKEFHPIQNIKAIITFNLNIINTFTQVNAKYAIFVKPKVLTTNIIILNMEYII